MKEVAIVSAATMQNEATNATRTGGVMALGAFYPRNKKRDRYCGWYFFVSLAAFQALYLTLLCTAVSCVSIDNVQQGSSAQRPGPAACNNA